MGLAMWPSCELRHSLIASLRCLRVKRRIFLQTPDLAHKALSESVIQSIDFSLIKGSPALSHLVSSGFRILSPESSVRFQLHLFQFSVQVGPALQAGRRRDEWG
ncbi:hypothetical protein Q5P01_003581 [Channa striata]|uniref:Uncharacterized protein n=1 Tax=Channa striata TaxID=64152 RepID=A0AA88T4W3_CHASR|nr:hypothetical protein Q5P01_003581 [Channa striata]